jgi:acetyl-CoA C-acetyltransferase
MTEVVIAGIGQTEVGEHWEVSLRELAYYAIDAAIKDAGGLRPQAVFAGNMLSPNLSKQAHLGVLISDFAGLKGIEATAVEAGNASGGAALRQGYLAVASGMIDAALVVGVEKFTDLVGAGIESALATSADSETESDQGITLAAQAAMLMRRYMHDYNMPADGLTGFALAAHAHGAGNKMAMFQKAIKPETYLKSDLIADPMNMFDMAPNADGSAAIILTRRDLLPPNFSHPLVRIASSATASDALALHDRSDLLAFNAVKLSADKAIKQASLDRGQINFFEYHDAFAIYAALSLEASGFIDRGQGWTLARDNVISIKGKLPCATMGGLKARGNPGGATGVYQAVEATLQLRGAAGSNQIPHASAGMIQSLGGPASTAVTHILTKIG